MPIAASHKFLRFPQNLSITENMETPTPKDDSPSPFPTGFSARFSAFRLPLLKRCYVGAFAGFCSSLRPMDYE